jgi:hypothetical protein
MKPFASIASVSEHADIILLDLIGIKPIFLSSTNLTSKLSSVIEVLHYIRKIWDVTSVTIFGYAITAYSPLEWSPGLNSGRFQSCLQI